MQLAKGVIGHHHSQQQQQLNSSFNHQQTNDLGLAMWKMHIESDEKRLIEQQSFLEHLKNNFN